jgi:hypothetical protein
LAQVAQSANLPAPFLGVEESIPKAVIKSPYCENLLNFNTTQAGISLRNGDSKYRLIENIPGQLESQTPLRLFQYGNEDVFALLGDNTTGEISLYDIDAGSVVGGVAKTGTGVLDLYDLYFNKYIFFFTTDTTAAPGFFYNGSTTGVIGYTGSGYAPIGGNVYRNRAYMIQNLDAAYWYSGIDAISGACTKIDLNGIVSEKCTLAVIASFSISQNGEGGAYELQAFIMTNGEVLFYEGSYPDSDNWRLVYRSKIGSPLAYNSAIKYQGDTLVFCDTGVISLRDLFLRGSTKAKTLSVNTKMQETWTTLVKAIRALLSIPSGPITPPQIRGVWDDSNSRIIISFPYYVNMSGVATAGSFYFIYDAIKESWFFHRSFGMASGKSIVDIVVYKNKVITMTPVSASVTMIYRKEGATGFTDRTSSDAGETAFDYAMLSAPIPFAKTAVYEATQIEPIMQSDLYAETNWNLVADFGRQTSGNQPLTDQGVNVTKPAVNVGMQNITYVQVKMSGTTAASKTVGLDLYSYNVWYNSGDTGSR